MGITVKIVPGMALIWIGGAMLVIGSLLALTGTEANL